MISLIVKRQIPSLSRRQLYRCDEAFCNEINAYKHVVPLLSRYTATCGSKDFYFPNCYFAGRDDFGEIIVLEDLKELGYRMEKRLAGLDFNYCESVMKELAKLHAASIAAKELNSDIFNEKRKHIREIVYCKEAEEFYQNILETSIQESLNSLRVSNVDGCLTEPIRLIEKLQTKLFRKIQNCIINSKDCLNVVCHGDLWVNNIMFLKKNSRKPYSANSCRYLHDHHDNGHNTESFSYSNVNSNNNIGCKCNVEQKQCYEMNNGGENMSYAVKFFDLQAMRYTSPVFDLLHFFYTSTKRDLRDTHTDRLLETYCQALASNLQLLFVNYQEQQQLLHDLMEVFSLRNITEQYYKHVFYGLAISMWILPAVTFDPNNIPNLDAISEMNTSAKEIKCTQKLTPEYHSRIKDIALEFYHNGYFNSMLLNDDN